MIKINDPSASDSISAAVGVVFNPACDVSIARFEGERLLGGVIYTGYTGASIAIHQAGFAPRWLNKTMLWMVFDYPFNQLKVKKLFGHVAASNVKVLELDLKFGFNIEVRVADVYLSGDMLLLSMTREQCRWLSLTPPAPGRIV